MSGRTAYKDETKQKIKRPSLYKVVIHNDDYTSMEFVVEILVEIFHKAVTEATKIMFDVHNKGCGEVGIYPYDIALTKIIQVEEIADEEGFPLKLTMEEE